MRPPANYNSGAACSHQVDEAVELVGVAGLDRACEHSVQHP